jgi:hypothetical protein
MERDPHLENSRFIVQFMIGTALAWAAFAGIMVLSGVLNS